MASVNPVYAYYRDIIPHDEHAEVYFNKPLAQTLWVNTLKISVSDFLALLKKDNIELVPLPWHSSGFRYQGEVSISKHWTYAAGLFQVQEAVSMLSGQLLNVQPHMSCLELCAAPGNKSAQMAVMMQNTGTLVANDISAGRMRAFGQIMKRLGLINVSISTQDARSFPNTGECFDALMVDAPCTCEGTLRKNLNKQNEPSSTKKSQVFAARQLEILLKAIKLAKPGARIMYSTCTFSPIENEGVVTKALAQMGDAIDLLPLDMANLVYSKGVNTWQGETYDERVSKCMRIWPHQNDTGGFFLALFVKKRQSNFKKVPLKHYDGCDISAEYPGVLERFEFKDDAMKAMAFCKASRKGVYARSADHAPPENVSYDASGILLLKTNMQFPKLSTAAAMLIGKKAQYYIIELNDKQRDAYMVKDDIELLPAQIREGFTTGYVLVSFSGVYLGLGLFFSANEHHNGVLRSLFRMALT